MVSSQNKISPQAGKFYIISFGGNYGENKHPWQSCQGALINNHHLLLDFFALWPSADSF
jgi:hypothetical protein